MFTQMIFSGSSGDQGTCLYVRPVVAYINTLLRPSVTEHLAYPIAQIRLNDRMNFYHGIQGGGLSYLRERAAIKGPTKVPKAFPSRSG